MSIKSLGTSPIKLHATERSKSPMAWAQGHWAGYEDGHRQEKRISITRDGTFVSKNKVFDGHTVVHEDSVVIKPESSKRGVLTFYKNDGSKEGITGKVRIGHDRIEAKGPGFSLKVYMKGDELVFDKAGKKLYADRDRHVLTMKRSQGGAKAQTSRKHAPDFDMGLRVFVNGKEVFGNDREQAIGRWMPGT
jgi:hypothetical protein